MKFLKKHWEVLSYLIFGVLTTLLNIVLYALFSRLFGYTAANSWGNVLDNALCILFAYCTNRAFVFRSKTTGKAMAKEFGTFVTCRLGTMVLDAVIMIVGGNLLAAQGISATVLDMYCVKPLDAEAVIEAAGATRAVVTVEEHSVIGGLGSAVADVLCEQCPTPL